MILLLFLLSIKNNMYSLSKHLLNDQWTLIIPNMINSFEIKVFDDGNEKYSLYENKWIIFGEWEDKFALFNKKDPNIIIQCISSWKIGNNI